MNNQANITFSNNNRNIESFEENDIEKSYELLENSIGKVPKSNLLRIYNSLSLETATINSNSTKDYSNISKLFKYTCERLYSLQAQVGKFFLIQRANNKVNIYYSKQFKSNTNNPIALDLQEVSYIQYSFEYLKNKSEYKILKYSKHSIKGESSQVIIDSSSKLLEKNFIAALSELLSEVHILIKYYTQPIS